MRMIHPLIKVIAMRPDLLAEHAGAYADLALAEVGEAATALRQRILLGALAVAMGCLALGLAGVAALLAAALPLQTMPLPWLLAALPMALAALATWAWWASRQQLVLLSWDSLKAEWAQDAALLARAGQA